MGRSEDSGVGGLAKQGHSQEGAFPGGWNRDQARKGWEPGWQDGDIFTGPPSVVSA